MSETLDINRIVHEVVRRLRDAGVRGPLGHSNGQSTPSKMENPVVRNSRLCRPSQKPCALPDTFLYVDISTLERVTPQL